MDALCLIRAADDCFFEWIWSSPPAAPRWRAPRAPLSRLSVTSASPLLHHLRRRPSRTVLTTLWSISQMLLLGVQVWRHRVGPKHTRAHRAKRADQLTLRCGYVVLALENRGRAGLSQALPVARPASTAPSALVASRSCRKSRARLVGLKPRADSSMYARSVSTRTGVRSRSCQRKSRHHRGRSSRPLLVAFAQRRSTSRPRESIT
jgi:hypothetical protein